MIRTFLVAFLVLLGGNSALHAQPFNTFISSLPTPGVINGSDVFYLQQGSNPTQVPSSQLGTYFSSFNTVTSNGSLAISPTTGHVVASLNLGNANSWSVTQTFLNIIDTNLISGGTQCVQATAAGLFVGTGSPCGSGGGGGGGVTSVNNSDGTLTIAAPTGPAVTVSLALSHANTWTAVQSITNGDLSLLGATSGHTLLEASAVAGTTVATFPANTGTVAELNFVQTWTAAQTFNAGDQTLVGTRSGKSFANDTPPANILRWNDKIFIGDAAANFQNNGVPTLGGSCPSPDWFTTFYGTTQEGSCAYTYGFQLVVETDASLLYNSGAILGTSQTKNVGHNQGALGVMGFMLNNHINDGIINFGGWAGYFECDQTVNNGTGCIGIEIDVGNTVGDALAGSPDPFQQSAIVPLQVACGSGFGTHPTVFKCGAAIQVVNNGQALVTGAYVSGIVFESNSVAPQILFGGGTSVAIALPALYSLIWYSAAGTAQGGIEFDASGNMQLGINNTIVVNGAGPTGAGVNCASGTVNGATVVVVKGIVTHC